MALAFDGTGDYAAYTTDSAVNGDTVTIACRANTPSSHGNVNYDIIFAAASNSAHKGIGIGYGHWFGSGDNFQLWLPGGFYGSGPSSWQFNSGATYTVDTWYSVIATSTKSAGTYAMYYNGTTKGTGTNTNFRWTGDVPIAMAAVPNSLSSQQGECRVADAAIWNVILSASERAMYDDGYSPLLIRPDALVFYAPTWGGGSVQLDLIGGRGLTVTNAVKYAHPRVIYPSRQHIFIPAAVAAGATANLVGVLA